MSLSKSKSYGRGFKLTFLGDSTVGKSSILERIHRGTFDRHKDSTIGAAYVTHTCNDILLNIWDTAGQERFMSLIPMYYRDADIVLLVFDLNNEYTIDRVEHYMVELSNRKNDLYKCIVVGNKSDLVDQTEQDILDRKIKKIADNHPRINVVEYIYTSAKTNKNINELIDTITEQCKRPDMMDKKSITQAQLDLSAQNDSSFNKSYCPC